MIFMIFIFFFFSSRRRHTRFDCDWSSDVCSSDLSGALAPPRLPIEDTYLELLADTLESLDLPARGQFLQRFLRAICHVELRDRKSTRLNSSHSQISYAVFCLKKKKRILTRYLHTH